MKRIRFSIIIIIAMYSLNLGSAHQPVGGGLNLSMKAAKIDSWLNLIPGSPGSFQFTGELKIKSKEDFDAKNLLLSNITVMQNNIELFSFTPAFMPKICIPHPTDLIPISIPWLESEPETDIIPSRAEKYYLFYTKSGITINKELDVDLPIKPIMLF